LLRAESLPPVGASLERASEADKILPRQLRGLKTITARRARGEVRELRDRESFVQRIVVAAPVLIPVGERGDVLREPLGEPRETVGIEDDANPVHLYQLFVLRAYLWKIKPRNVCHIESLPDHTGHPPGGKAPQTLFHEVYHQTGQRLSHELFL